MGLSILLSVEHQTETKTLEMVIDAMDVTRKESEAEEVKAK